MKPLVPALCAIGVTDDIKMLQGQRVRAKMTLETTSGLFSSEGELQFIDHALSGIAMFELSSYYAREIVQGISHHPSITLDLMPSLSDQQLAEYLTAHIDDSSITNNSLEGILAPKLSHWLYHRFSNQFGHSSDINKLSYLIKHCTLSVDTKYVPKSYQIMAGGIDTSQVDKVNLQSYRYHNLFIGGEVLDIDGLCGGYNLHFAFASGQLIAQTIFKKEGITYEEDDRFNRP
jgi:predicted flavoprotein YhiN